MRLQSAWLDFIRRFYDLLAVGAVTGAIARIRVCAVIGAVMAARVMLGACVRASGAVLLSSIRIRCAGTVGAGIS